MLINTELLLVQLNSKMDRLIELLEGSLPAEYSCTSPIDMYCGSAPLIKHSSYGCGAAGKEDTDERGEKGGL